MADAAVVAIAALVAKAQNALSPTAPFPTPGLLGWEAAVVCWEPAVVDSLDWAAAVVGIKGSCPPGVSASKIESGSPVEVRAVGVALMRLPLSLRPSLEHQSSKAVHMAHKTSAWPEQNRKRRRKKRGCKQRGVDSTR
jgi:hypothetical protein